MDLVRKWGLLLTMGCVLGAQTVDDPVMKARLQRAQAQGIEESDLPPVPRGVMEPPPLPPTEIHAKDAPHPQVAKPSRRRGGKLRAGRQAKAAVEAEAEAPAPARKGRSAAAPVPKGRSAAAPVPRGKSAAVAAPGPKAKSTKHARPAGKVARRAGKRGKA
jgi:hypothetical protein